MKKVFIVMMALCLGLAGTASAQLWQNQDIGGPSMAGSTSYNSTTGTYTIQGGGIDIWGTADHFQFVWVEVGGDFDIVAHVVSCTGSNAWRKAGLMARETLGDGSVNVAMLCAPGQPTATWQKREAAGGSSTSQHTNSMGQPVWVRITRVGNTFTGYYSSDGTSWSQEGTSWSLSMASTIYVGLVVTSHDDPSLATAVIDNVTINGVPFGGEAWGAVGWDPAPLARDVPVGVYPLAWTVQQPSGQTIQYYKVYLGTSKDAVDPNNPSVEDLLVGGAPVTETTVDSPALVNDKTYYWRVASYVSDANFVDGVIVSFDTISYGPEITQQPQDTRFGAACSAELSVVAGPKVEGQGGTITYQWYKVGTPDAAVGTNASTYQTNVNGDYYVIVSNDAGEDVSEVATVAASVHAAPGGGDGQALYEQFAGEGAGGQAGAREMLTADSAGADYSETLSATIWDGTDRNNYRGRITAWLLPTESGTYQFRLASDDDGSLWLGASADPASAVEICQYSGYSGVNEWGKFATQTSDPVELTAGLVYFLRAGYREGTGGDHVHVQWKTPSADWADITGNVMNSFLPDQWAAQNIALSPVDGNGWLDYNAENVTVTWDKAQYAPCDAVYTLYLRMESMAGNMNEFVAYSGTDLQAVIANTGLLKHDQMWYGRIDVSSAAGADTETGETFSVSTIKWVPEIDQNPKDLNVVKAGSNLTLNCVSTALNDDAAAMKEYRWYHVGDANPVYTGVPAEISRDGKRYYDCSVTLTIEGIGHEGFYYCVAENDNGTATSNQAKVLVERLIVHYEFESLNGITVSDSSPAGEFDGTLTSTIEGGKPAGVTIVAGMVGNALDLTGGKDPNSGYVATSASAFDLGIRGANPRSVSVWAKSRDMARSGVYFVGQPSLSMAVFGLHNENGDGGDYVYQFDHWGSNFNYTGDLSAYGNWVHIAHVYDGQRIRIYVDGVKVADYGASLNTASGGDALPLLVGFWPAYNAAYQHGVFDGVIDDFRLYNYALSPVEVGNLWVLGGGAGGCMGVLSQDTNGDCRVDLVDFADLAASWMDSSLVTP